MFEKLRKEIQFAKSCIFPQCALYQVYGQILMALELKAITIDEYMILNHECVADGINNPKYFDRY